MLEIMKHFRLSLFAVLVAVSPAWAEEPLNGKAEPFKGKAEHVVLVVWDGMRPDFVRADTTPVLDALAKRGTFFADQHSVYVTSTEVNGTAIATGCYPMHNGILANVEFRPDIQPYHPVAMESAETCKKGDAVREGKYIRVPTLAEIIQQAGQRTVVAGTKSVALLHDRSPNRPEQNASTILFAGKAYPASALEPIVASLGKFPPPPGVAQPKAPAMEKAAGDVPAGAPAVPAAAAEKIVSAVPTPVRGVPPSPNTAQNAWTTRALVEELWREGIPRFTTLWLGDPDFSQHMTQPGSPVALAAIRDSDNELGMVIAALQKKGVLDKTDIFVVSDHGFSTTDGGMDLGTRLNKAGFHIVRGYHKTPMPGEILQVSLGGSIQFYVPNHDAEWVQKLVAFLQASDFAGPIFTRSELPGTFPLSAARIETPDSPDVLFSVRWTNAKNINGTRGTFKSEGQVGGNGVHASLSRYDIHNTLVAAGPDIRAGFRDTLPTANVDVAPTILHLLGIPGGDKMDGRVLLEALPAVDFHAPKPETKTIEARAGKWRQYLKITTLGDRTYLDEGNAGTPTK